MSDEKPQAKKKLNDILKLISQMLEETGTKEGDDGYDAKFVTILHLLRLSVLRTSEYVMDFRQKIGAILEVLVDPTVKQGEKWRSDLPALRKQVRDLTEVTKEMSALLKDLVKNPDETSSPKTDGNEGEEEASTSPVDELAAAIARGEKPDLTQLIQTTPTPPAQPAPVVPIRGGGNNTQ